MNAGHGTASARRTIDWAEHRQMTLGDAEYVWLEAGHGPLVVLLHGYPDTAYSWEHQLRGLAAAGYRVVAPFLRGYAPTRVPAHSYFDRATLADDVVALIRALNHDQAAFLVGQDWGAAIAYGVLGAYPHWVRRAVILAVPHPVEIRRTLRRSPRHVLRSFHWFLFQLPWLPEALIRGSRGGFLRLLWRLWSPRFADHAHVDHIVATQLEGQGVEHALAYYRAMTRPRYRDPSRAALYARLDDPIRVPTRVLCGDHDLRRELLPRQADQFAPEARYHWQLVPGAGHFLHREQPEAVNRAILDWLAAEAA